METAYIEPLLTINISRRPVSEVSTNILTKTGQSLCTPLTGHVDDPEPLQVLLREPQMSEASGRLQQTPLRPGVTLRPPLLQGCLVRLQRVERLDRALEPGGAGGGGFKLYVGLYISA